MIGHGDRGGAVAARGRHGAAAGAVVPRQPGAARPRHRARSTRSRSTPRPTTVTRSGSSRLIPCAAVESALDEHGRRRAVMMRMGMYQGDEHPADDVRKLYCRDGARGAGPAASRHRSRRAGQVRAEVRAGAKTRPPRRSTTRRQSRLRMYLLLTRAATPTASRGSTRPRSAGWLRIAEPGPGRCRSPTTWRPPERCRRSRRRTWTSSAADKELLFERDDKLVKNVRKILKRTDRTDACSPRSCGDVDAPDLDLRTLTDRKSPSRTTTGWCTGRTPASAWEDVVRDA